MGRTKVDRYAEREVIYSPFHWNILREKRDLATEVLEYLASNGITGYIFGSVARGDIHQHSDIEIIVPKHELLSYVNIILSNKFSIVEIEITQATPKTAMKLTFHLGNSVDVVIPVVPLTQLEHEFYKYGGIIGLPEAKNFKNRVSGVDKRLCIIIPTEAGHIEYSILGRESEVAKILGITTAIIEERKRMLLKRDTIGRTGVFINIRLNPSENIYRVIKGLKDKNPIVRRLFRERGTNL